MAIAFRAAGTWDAATTNNQTVTIPSGVLAGDMMLLAYGTKPYNDAPTIDNGWLSIGSATDGTVAAGVDVGSMQTRFWYKIHTGSESNPTITNTTNNVSGAVILAFSRDAGFSWVTPVGSGGGDATAGADFSVTAASDVGHIGGDWIVSVAAIRSDAGTQSAQNITAPGIFTGTFTKAPSSDLATASGGDMAAASGYIDVTTPGPSSGAPTYVSSLAANHTGSCFMTRLRQIADVGNLAARRLGGVRHAARLLGSKGLFVF